MSSAGWCCHDDDGNGFWYTDQYPEEVFFEHWSFMAERYLNNPLVIGADLRNEVRGVVGKCLKFKARNKETFSLLTLLLSYSLYFKV